HLLVLFTVRERDAAEMRPPQLPGCATATGAAAPLPALLPVCACSRRSARRRQAARLRCPVPLWGLCSSSRCLARRCAPGSRGTARHSGGAQL
uniref:Uncharacterized protein n=1 Tax=Aegilops tauschii subsp. strangulata TaxID=200361 RepID=A0A453RIX1_AEGTS